MFLELIRRVQREYDYYLKAKNAGGSKTLFHFSFVRTTKTVESSESIPCVSPEGTTSAPAPVIFQPSRAQHAVRSLLYILQFVNAYLIMLLAMVCSLYFRTLTASITMGKTAFSKGDANPVDTSSLPSSWAS